MPKCNHGLAQALESTPSVAHPSFEFRISFQRLQALERQLALARYQVTRTHCTALQSLRRDEPACMQWSEKRQRGTVACCVMLDLDDFRSIGDMHGRPVADTALLHFSSTLLQHVRQTDMLARLGGDAFALVLPQTRLAGAFDVVEHLRRVVLASPLAYEGLNLTLRFSAAIAEQRQTEHLSDTLARAGTALPAAKSVAMARTHWQATKRATS